MTKAEKQAKWKALGPALIQRPLRYIKNKTAKVIEVEGKQVTQLSREFYIARDMAEIGRGDYVSRIAHLVHQGVYA